MNNRAVGLLLILFFAVPFTVVCMLADAGWIKYSVGPEQDSQRSAIYTLQVCYHMDHKRRLYSISSQGFLQEAQ